MTGYDLHTRIDELIGQRGVQNMYCLSLEGSVIRMWHLI